VVEREKIIDDTASVQQGDILIGLLFSGVHSNVYSLIRKIFSREDLLKDFHGYSLYEALLKSTRLYNDIVHRLLERFTIHGLAHITGGWILENIPRIILEGLYALIDVLKIPVQPVFELIQSIGKIPQEEMCGPFNMGIGMVVVVSPEDRNGVFQYMRSLGEKFFVIGSIEKGPEKISFKKMMYYLKTIIKNFIFLWLVILLSEVLFAQRSAFLLQDQNGRLLTEKGDIQILHSLCSIFKIPIALYGL